MKFQYRETQPDDPEFLSLVAELNLALSQITNDSGESSFTPQAFNPKTDACIVLSSNGTAVACGVFRFHDRQSCELKRMYSKQRGAGSYLIRQLEACAIRKGYRQAVLSTRRVNTQAVGFYQHQGYRECGAYGKYVDAPESICLSKVLPK